MELLTGLGDVLWATYDFVVFKVLPFLVLITIIVFIHELGHFLIGRLFRVGVNVFSIGFGKELAGWTDKHGTRWRIAAIPLGGYVKFEGDEGAASTPDRKALEQMDEAKYGTTLASKPVAQRAAVVAAGPIANFLLAIVVFAIIFTVYGREITKPMVTALLPGQVAEKAGFKVGDVIRSIDGAPIAGFDELAVEVGSNPGTPLRFVVERDGKEIEIVATPKMTVIDAAFGRKARIGRLGIQGSTSKDMTHRQHFTLLQALRQGGIESWDVVRRSGKFIWELIRGRQNVDQLGGPIMIAQISGAAAERGLDVYLHFLAVISIGIGLLNLMPVPILDGGHLLFYAIEAVTGRPLNERAQDIGYRIGFALVLCLMILVFWNDGSAWIRHMVSS